MNAVFEFMASSAGRLVRMVAGLILVVVGILLVEQVWGWILIIVGLVPLLAGVFDVCVFAPLFGLPFVGARLRSALERREQ